MAVDPARAKSLFLAALDHAAPGERAAYLDRECGTDAPMRHRVEALLAADQGAGSLSQAQTSNGLPLHPRPFDHVLPEAHVAPQIEGYKVVGYLGAGAMGVVWKALQLSVGREVALKVIRLGNLSSEKAQLRFSREVRTCANLEHPNVARVYDSGPQHGVHFCAMELIDGVPLDRFVLDQKLSRQQILGLMETVCRAVDFAHQRGVIHRDLL